MSTSGFTFQPKPEGNHYVTIHLAYKLITDGKASTAGLLDAFDYLAKSTLTRSMEWEIGDPIPDVIEIEGNVQNALLMKLLDGLLKETSLKSKIKVLESQGFIKTRIEAGRYRRVHYNYRAIADALNSLDLVNPSKSDGSKSEGSSSKSDGSGSKSDGSRGQKLPATIPNSIPNSIPVSSSPLTPQGGDVCDPPPSEETEPEPEEQEIPADGKAQKFSSAKNGGLGGDKGSAPKKPRFPQLTQARTRQIQDIWNDVTSSAPWFSGWQSTDKALKDALNAFWVNCHEQGLDPFEVLRVALTYARDKSPFWGSPPQGGGKWTPIKLFRKTKGHLFSLYAEAIAPTSSHPYPHLEGKGLSGVWVGPGELDFDPDLITVISKGREQYGKAFDDESCKLSVVWMIENNKLSMLSLEWSKAQERKRAIAQNQAIRTADAQSQSFKVWFDWAYSQGYVAASQQQGDRVRVLIRDQFYEPDAVQLPEHWVTADKAREMFPMEVSA